MCRKAEVKKKKLMKSQAKERGRVLDDAQHLRDPLEFVKVWEVFVFYFPLRAVVFCSVIGS